jgi:hypothetical protein
MMKMFFTMVLAVGLFTFMAPGVAFGAACGCPTACLTGGKCHKAGEIKCGRAACPYGVSGCECGCKVCESGNKKCLTECKKKTGMEPPTPTPGVTPMPRPGPIIPGTGGVDDQIRQMGTPPVPKPVVGTCRGGCACPLK